MTTQQHAIKATMMRGGTSRALYIRADDLPVDVAKRDAILLAAMGSPDTRQIDGVGGAHPLTSKVALLSAPTRKDADIDYLFLQVSVDSAMVSDAQNCGNVLAGVGPWAIENGFVEAASDSTDVAVHMVNSGSMAMATVCTPDGEVNYSGDTRIDGVPGTAAAVQIKFLDTVGAICGSLLPTGNAMDTVHGMQLTCIDNGMPVVLLRARDVGVSGYEAPAQLEANLTLKKTLEALRIELGQRMQLGDVTHQSTPKMCLVSRAKDGSSINTRTFIPHRVHDAIGVLGAVSVATACALPGTVAFDLIEQKPGSGISVGHPTGSVELTTEHDARGNVKNVAMFRTARKLFQGDIFVPQSVNTGLRS